MTISSQKLITFLFGLLFFFLPLVFTPYNFELFEFNKTLVLFALTSLITLTWLAACLEKKKCLYKKHFLFLVFLAFLFSQFISTITSSDKYLSLWGYYSRFHQSLLHSLAYFLLFEAYITWIDKKTSQKLLNLSLASLILISIYAVGQHFGIDASYWLQDVKNRVFSTLGQPNWLASYVLLTFYIVLYNSIKVYRSGTKVITTVLGFLFLSSLFFTKSRSGYLGLLGGLIILITSLLYFSKKKNIINHQTIFLTKVFVILTVLTSFFIWNPTSYNLNHLYRLVTKRPSQRLTVQRNHIPFKREYHITPSSKIREIVWKGGIKLWLLKPKNIFLGTGVETFAFNYYLTRPKKHNLTSEWDYIYNKAHNEYLNFLVTTGLVGFLTYLGLIIASYFLFFSQADEYSPFFLAGYTSFLITNFFGFSVVPTALIFYLYPAIFISLKEKKQPSDIRLKLNSWQNSLKFIPLLIIAGFILRSLFNWWLADYYLAKTTTNLKSQNYLQAVKTAYRSYKLFPYQPIYKVKLAEALTYETIGYNQQLQVFKKYLSTSSATNRQKGRLIVNRLEKTINLNQDLIHQLLREAISSSPTNLEYQKTAVKIDVLLSYLDKRYYYQAINLLKKMIKKAPTDPKLVYNLGLIYNMVGDKKSALINISKAIELKPDYQAALHSLHLLEKEK